MKKEEIIKQIETNYQMFLQLVWELRQVKNMTLRSFIDNVSIAYELKRECNEYPDIKLDNRTEKMSIAIERFLKLYVGLYDLYLDVQEEDNETLKFTVEEYLTLLRDDKKKDAYQHNIQLIENRLAKIDFKDYIVKKKNSKKTIFNNERQIKQIKGDYLSKLQTVRKKLSRDLKNGFTFDFYYKYMTGYYSRSLKVIEKSFVNQATLKQVTSPLKEKAIRREIKEISKAMVQLDNLILPLAMKKVTLKNGERLSLHEIDLLNDVGYYDMISRLPEDEVKAIEKQMRKLSKELAHSLSSKKKKKHKKESFSSKSLAVVKEKINHWQENSKLYDKWMTISSKCSLESEASYHYRTCRMIQENVHHLRTKKALQIQKRLEKTAKMSLRGNDDQDMDTITKLSASCMEKKLDKALYSTNLDREDNYLALLESASEYMNFYHEQKSSHKRGFVVKLSAFGVVACLSIASLFRLGNANSKEFTAVNENTIETDMDEDDLTFTEPELETSSIPFTPSSKMVTEKVVEKEREKTKVEESGVLENTSNVKVVSNNESKEDSLVEVPSVVSNLEVSPLAYLEEFTLQEGAKVYSNIHMNEEEGKVPYYDQDVVRQAYKVVFLLDGEEYDVLLSDVELCQQYQNLGAEVIGYLAVNENSKDVNGNVNPSLVEGFYQVDDVKQLVR
jgi:hypothetical protein